MSLYFYYLYSTFYLLFPIIYSPSVIAIHNPIKYQLMICPKDYNHIIYCVDSVGLFIERETSIGLPIISPRKGRVIS